MVSGVDGSMMTLCHQRKRPPSGRPLAGLRE
jgi:hypothetical protein